MKKISFLVISVISNLIYSQTNYAKGFNDGYKKGYCHDKGVGCIEPTPPISPIPVVGEDSNNYQDGYNRGFRTATTFTSENKQSTKYKTSSRQYVDDFVYNPNKNPYIVNMAIKLAELRSQKEYERNEIINELYTNAQNNIEDGDIDTALRNLFQIRNLDPDNPQIYAQSAVLYFSLNKFLDAYNNYIKAEKLNYSDIYKISYIKDKSIGYVSYSMSVENYVDVLNFTRNVWFPNEVTNFYLALSHYYMKNFEEAKDLFKKNKNYLNSKEYLDAIKKDKFIANPYINISK